MIFTTWKGSRTLVIISIIMRYLLLIASIVMAVLYFLKWKLLEKYERTFEHNTMLFLSISLIFFNDPLFLLVVLTPIDFFESIGVLLVVQFVCLLFYFWLVLGLRIKNNENTAITTQNTLPIKIIPILAFILISIPAIYFNITDD